MTDTTTITVDEVLKQGTSKSGQPWTRFRSSNDHYIMTFGALAQSAALGPGTEITGVLQEDNYTGTDGREYVAYRLVAPGTPPRSRPAAPAASTASTAGLSPTQAAFALGCLIAATRQPGVPPSEVVVEGTRWAAKIARVGQGATPDQQPPQTNGSRRPQATPVAQAAPPPARPVQPVHDDSDIPF